MHRVCKCGGKVKKLNDWNEYEEQGEELVLIKRVHAWMCDKCQKHFFQRARLPKKRIIA
jgi:YgiT-type zinc finger domain-containing protein